MKNLFLFILLLTVGIAQAQTTIFSEDFETLPLSVTSSGSSSWERSTTLFSNGAYSDTVSLVNAGDITRLTTNSFSTTGYLHSRLVFKHICKVHYLDSAYLEISTDNGSTWTRLTDNSYLGSGNFGIYGNRFTAGTYPTKWHASDANTVPQNSWWVTEVFSLDSFMNNANTKIRFVIADGNNNGADNNYGWLLDEIRIEGSNYELSPPSISIQSPYPHDTIYSTGVFEINTYITDNSGIESANIVYNIGGVYDTIAMQLIQDSSYKGFIPSYGYDTEICYHIIATDSSANNNIGKYPPNDCISFYIKRDPNLPTPFHYDAMPYSFDNPLGVTIANTPEDVILRIANKGDSLLTKTHIGWKIDGVQQSNYLWTGTLSLDQISDTINLQNTIFSVGPHNITTWTYLPNDSNDQKVLNDTLSYSIYACNEILNGTYTLGGASADFLNFEELMNALNNCGMSGTTTILVNPGIYNETVNFTNSIIGLDEDNTLTIKSASNNANDVIIKHNAISDNYVVGFDNVSYISFEGISIESIGSSSATGIRIYNNSTNINIKACRITVPLGNNTNTCAINIDNGLMSHINISNNYLYGGTYGIYLHGLSNTKFYNNTINNNHIIDAFSTGINAIYQKNIVVNNNKIERNYYSTAQTYITGIKLMQVHGYTMNKNNISININTSGYGMSILQTTNGDDDISIISNNMISVDGTSNSSYAHGIYAYNNTDLNIYNNSILMKTGGSKASACYINGSTSTANIRNNVFTNKSTGYAFMNYVTSIDTVDYNNYYTNGIKITKWGSTYASTNLGISEIRAKSGKDVHSTLSEPMFYSNVNLHSFSQTLNNAGTFINEVSTDIDGELRNTTNPDIGADEFTISTTDVGITNIININPVDTQSNIVNIKALFRNYGLDTITSLVINYSLNGGNYSSHSWSGSVAHGEIDTVDLGNITLPALNYTIEANCTLNGDTIASNDSLLMNLYALPLIELQALAIESPSNGCDKSSNETINILIANNGVDTIFNGATASYQIIGGNLVSETINDTILPNDTIIFTFNQTADLSVGYNDSTFSIIIAANHNDDPKHNNDSIISNIVSMGELLPPTISDTTIFYGTSVDLEAGSNDPLNWYSNDSTISVLDTGSIYTTPILFDTTTYYVQANNNTPASLASIGFASTKAGAFDNNIYGRLSSAGKYQILYTANELISAGLTAGEIESIEFHVGVTNGNYIFSSFDISMANVQETSLTTTFLTPSLTDVYSAPLTGPKGVDTWISHDLTNTFVWDGVSSLLIQICSQGSSYNAPKVYYTTTSTNKFLVSVDNGTTCSTQSGSASGQKKRPNIRIHTKGSIGCTSIRVPTMVKVPLPPIDAHLASFSQPENSCGLSSTPITIDIVNNGLDTIPAGFTATYKINSGSYINNETINSIIAPEDTLHYTFNTTASLPSGNTSTTYTLTAKIFVPNDNYVGNDSLVNDSIVSNYTPSDPTTSDIGVIYSNPATLSASSIDSIFWYSDALGSYYLGDGNNYITDNIYDTTTFYAQARRSIAEAYYNIGTSNNISDATGPSPYGATDNGSRMQFLIKASELNALGIIQGPISSISFYVSNANTTALSNYTIRIGYTNKNNMLASTLNNNLTTVSTTPNYSPNTGWNEHILSTPFNWDGSSNIIIETCFNNNFSTPFSTVKYTTTPFTSVAYRIAGNSFNCNDSIVTGNSTHRPNIRIKQKGLATCASNLIPLTVNVLNTVNTDAGIETIVEPSGVITSIDSTPVKVILKNYGFGNITSATIKWTSKGIAQTPYNWTGNLIHNAIDTVTIANNHIFKGGVTDLEIWVELNNDTISSNDSTSTQLLVSMSGAYTINSTNGDYQDFSSAISELSTVGVCAPVFINADSGTYSGRFTVYQIPGTSTLNTVTFQSTDLDSSKVQIIDTNLNSNENYIVKFIGASNINFKHLNINAIGTQYGNVIVFENSSNNIEFSNNIINSTTTSTTNSKASTFFSNSLNINNININNNVLLNGYKSIYFNSICSDINISGNIIKFFNGSGVYFYNVTNSTINNNTIESHNLGSSIYGISLNIISDVDVSKNNIICNSSSKNNGIYLRGNGIPNNHIVLSNNFISITDGSSSNIGIYITLSNYIDIFYNSINIIHGGATSNAIKLNGGSYLTVKNNSFATEVGYAVSLSSIPSNLSFDYNNIYVNPTNSNSFVYWSTAIADIATLKAFDSNNNQHSISKLSHYASDTDLHSQAVDLYHSGIAISGITTDIDNDIRNSIPCIGADEFTPIAIDISLTELISPNESDCGLSSSDSIVIRVQNMGIDTLDFNTSNATINLYISGIINDTISLIMNSGILTGGNDTVIILSNSYNFSQIGNYIFNGEINIANDGNSLNNSLPEANVINYPNINTFPYTEDFDNGINLSFKEISSSESDIKISISPDNTNSHELNFKGGSSNNWNIPSNVTEAFNNIAHTATAESCNIDATSLNSLYLKFKLRQTKYSQYYNNTSWFRVMLTDSNSNIHYLKTINGDSVFTPTTTNIDSISSLTFNLNQYTGQNFRISFESVCKFIDGYYSTIGDNAYIDDIMLWIPSNIDVAVEETWAENFYKKTGDSVNISVAFTNVGFDTLYSIPFACQANNITILMDTAVGVFPPFVTDSFTFSGSYTLSNGDNNISIISLLSNDSEQSNDTAYTTIIGLNTFNVEFADDFELNNNWAADYHSNQWELGSPNSSFITSAHSGQNAWATRLESNHKIGGVDYLYSPYLVIPSYADTASIEFWMTMNVDNPNAYGQLEYSTDGVLWIPVGYIGAITSSNWYNTSINNKHVWSLSNYSWQESSIRLDPAIFNTGNEFQLRFSFYGGNSSLAFDGWAIDDFKLSIPPQAIDAGIIEILTPSDTTIAGDIITTIVTIKNFGSDTLTSIPVEYSIAGTQIASETWTGSLLPDSIVNYSFTTTYPAPNQDYSLCASTNLANDIITNNNELCKQITSLAGAIDAGISEILLPNGQTPIGQQVTVKVTIFNYGTDAISNIPVEYTINGTLHANETYSGTINSNDSTEYTFTTKYTSLIGNYTICVSTNYAGDVDASNDEKCTVVMGTALDIADNTLFLVGQNQPNPASDITKIEFYIPKSGDISFEIVNMTGSIVEQRNKYYSQGKNEITLNPNKYPAGIYYYSVSFEGQRKTFKMVIVR